MDLIDLPFVAPDIAAEAAIGLIQKAGRSGLVTRQHGKHVVLTATDLVDALRERGDLTIAKIAPSETSLEVVEPRTITIENVRTFGSSDLFDVFNKFKTDYIIPAPSGDTINVVTAHEGLAQRLSGRAVVCRCQADASHVWRPGQLANGKCAQDGSAVTCG